MKNKTRKKKKREKENKKCCVVEVHACVCQCKRLYRDVHTRKNREGKKRRKKRVSRYLCLGMCVFVGSGILQKLIWENIIYKNYISDKW